MLITSYQKKNGRLLKNESHIHYGNLLFKIIVKLAHVTTGTIQKG